MLLPWRNGRRHAGVRARQPWHGAVEGVGGRRPRRRAGELAEVVPISARLWPGHGGGMQKTTLPGAELAPLPAHPHPRRREF